jgi:hypothetical protein
MTTIHGHISPREAAKDRGERLDSIYKKLWAGRIPGARKSDGRWLIPSEFVTASRTNKRSGGPS